MVPIIDQQNFLVEDMSTIYMVWVLTKPRPIPMGMLGFNFCSTVDGLGLGLYKKCVRFRSGNDRVLVVIGF